MSDTTWVPVILKAVFTPNPVPAGQPFVLEVLAVDRFGGEQAEIHASNEFHSGEV